MTTTLELARLQLAESGKSDLCTYADALVETYYTEGYDTLLLMAEAAKLELIAARIKEKAKAVSVREVQTYGREGVTKLGVSMTIREVGTTYDYSTDQVWQQLKDRERIAADHRKQHENYLRALPDGGKITINDETGELYCAYRPAKEASDGIILTIR